MAAAALLLYGAGTAAAFGWRTWRQWRRTHDTGLRLHAGPVGSVAWWAKLLFVSALLLGFAGPIAGIAGLAPVPTLHTAAAQVAGTVLATLGTVATLAAQAAMGASWRIGVDPGEQTSLVTTGPFAVVRNPIFAAMMATSAGLALMVPNVVSLLATATLVVSIQVQVRAVEEPHLARTHADTYRAYAGRVGRFLPRPAQLQAARAEEHAT